MNLAGYKAGKLYSSLPSDGTGDFTVSRASQGSLINSDLKIENVANNVPRFTYDTLNGCPSLLTEPQSTNLITYPVSFDNSYWAKSGSSVVSGQASPHVDYPTSAFKLVEDTGTGSHYMEKSFVVASGAANKTYSYSVRAKAEERNWLRLKIRDYDGAVTHQCFFDLTNGVVGTTDNTISSSIKLLADGNYECSFTALMGATANRLKCDFGLCDADNSASYTGDGTSGVYIFGAQLEQQVYPTSFIYNGTEGATVTRIADVITGAGDVNTFNDREGVLFVEIASLGNEGTYRVISISSGAINDRVIIRYNPTNNELAFRLIVSGILVYNKSKIVSSALDFHKMAIRWKDNDMAVYEGGVLLGSIVTTASSFSTGTLDRLNLSEYNSVSDKFSGKIKSIQVYNTALTDLELETLTSYRSWLSMVNELNYNIIYNG